MNVSTILDSIDAGTIALPEFQRGYVWGREQVRELMRSLYKRYPVGSLLLWVTDAETITLRGRDPAGQVVKLLLDGQQRVTSLYGVMRGSPPAFFQGNAKAFTDLYFDLRTETFEFYGPVKMESDPLWVNVTELYRTGMEPWFTKLNSLGLDGSLFGAYSERLNRIVSIRDVDFHPEEITGPRLGLDEIVDIFNRVNSGGTKLSKGDLALARICAAWPEARQEMVRRLDEWRSRDFDFTLDWLLRVANAVLTGEAPFSALAGVTPTDFRSSLSAAAEAVDHLLNLIGARLGLDHDRVLGGRYALPVMARGWATTSGRLSTADQDKLLYWYLHAALWGRHSGSTETMLNQDLQVLDRDGLDGLIDQLRIWRGGELRVRPENLTGVNRGSRFYPLLYLLTRVHGARDLGSGLPLSKMLLGKLASLELHHVFPKAFLAARGYDTAQRNAIANFCFLTQETNLEIGRTPPAEYLLLYEARHPGVLASQWIPTDPALWEPAAYGDFLAARRELLADAANDFFESLLGGEVPATGELDPTTRVVVSDPQALHLAALARLAEQLGLARPEIDHEIVDADSGEILALADLAWPDGVRTGLTDPVAYLSEADEDMERRLGHLGYRFFVSDEGLRWYFEEILGLDLDEDGIVGPPAEDVAEQPESTAGG